MGIQTDIQNAVSALQNLDKGMTLAADVLRAELEERLISDKEKHERDLELKDEALKEYKEEVADAVRFWNKVDAEEIGWLKTDSPGKRIVFEKLADRWDYLTNAELEDLEGFLSGKLNFI